jgi:hypothetical protein
MDRGDVINGSPSAHVVEGRRVILRLVNADAGDWHGLAVRRFDSDEVTLAPTTVRGVTEKSFDLGRLPAGIYGLTCSIAAGMRP